MPSPDLSTLVSQYGYVAVAIGAMIEGEMVLLIAGFMAHQGYLYPPYVALAAICGSLASDQGLFFLGRWKGEALLRRFPRLAAGVAGVNQRVRGHETLLILIFRFLYGLRNVTPVFLGVNRTPLRLFIPLNIVGAIIWACLFTFVGYSAGNVLTRIFGRLHRYEPYIVAVLAVLGLVIWLWRRKRHAAAKP